jgi:hypothetical protein
MGRVYGNKNILYELYRHVNPLSFRRWYNYFYRANKNLKFQKWLYVQTKKILERMNEVGGNKNIIGSEGSLFVEVVTSGRGGHFARATTHYSVRSPLH